MSHTDESPGGGFSGGESHGAESHGAGMASALESVRSALSASIAELAPARPKMARDQRLWIQLHDVVGAQRCPRSIVDSGTFVESAPNLRRRVGLLALNELADAEAAHAPVDHVRAVRRIVSGGGLSHDVVEWLDQLPPGGRTQVVASAATWVGSVIDSIDASVTGLCSSAGVHAVNVFDWRWQRPNAAAVWEDPASALLLRARSEALSTANLRSRELQILLVSDRGHDADRSRLEAAFVALVFALHSGVVPNGIAMVQPRRRCVELTAITADHLFLAAKAIEVAVRARVDQFAAVTRPGTHCKWCPIREVCSDALSTSSSLGAV